MQNMFLFKLTMAYYENTSIHTQKKVPISTAATQHKPQPVLEELLQHLTVPPTHIL